MATPIAATDQQACKKIIGSYPSTVTSSLYTMIPSVVRSRIPVLSSIRRSAKSTMLRRFERRTTFSGPKNVEDDEDTFSTASTVTSTGTSTPRPGSPESGNIFALELSSGPLSRRQAQSQVDWDVAGAGVRLWICARAQAQQSGESPAVRSMHIDAIRYMHMALPADLTAAEIESLRSSISPELLVQMGGIEFSQMRRENPLRQGIAQMVCWVIASVLFFLPLLMTVLNNLLQFEREHQVTERFITNGLNFTNTLGERGLDLHLAMTRFKDGRFGNACFRSGAWLIEGVIGGLNDGISQSVGRELSVGRSID